MSQPSDAFPGAYAAGLLTRLPTCFFSDPKLMPRWIDGVADGGRAYDSSGTSRLAGVAAFWTDMAIRGVAVDSNFTAATPKTILTTTSPTTLFSIVGPAGAVTDTQTITITGDWGTYTTPASPALVARGRTYLGPLVLAGDLTTADTAITPLAAVAASNNWSKAAAVGMYVPPQDWFFTFGAPCLYSKSGITVSITTSANITGTANQERQSGCSYRVLT